jgi:hypothetical protein
MKWGTARSETMRTQVAAKPIATMSRRPRSQRGRENTCRRTNAGTEPPTVRNVYTSEKSQNLGDTGIGRELGCLRMKYSPPTMSPPERLPTDGDAIEGPGEPVRHDQDTGDANCLVYLLEHLCCGLNY